MDPLSNVLALLKPRCYLSAGIDAGGAWAIQFPDQQDGIKCGAVVAGECWLAVDGIPGAVHLRAGDSFVLPSGRPFRVASAEALTSPDAAATTAAPCASGIASYNGGGDVLLLTTRFALDGRHAGLLVRTLPPVIHIHDAPSEAALAWPVSQMMRELREPQPGGALVVQHLAQVILVQALRQQLAAGMRGGVGWLFALGDEQMRTALNAMHDDPARRWTLDELARLVGMSRSSFALRFKTTVGTSPMAYLAHWRMLLAADRLTSSADPVSVVATSLGYDSETSFSLAFKKIMGRSPRRYGRSRSGATR